MFSQLMQIFIHIMLMIELVKNNEISCAWMIGMSKYIAPAICLCVSD